METLIAEQPLMLSLMLAVLAGGLIYGWLQTDKKEAGIAGTMPFIELLLTAEMTTGVLMGIHDYAGVVGSIITFWNRRSSAPSFSIY